MTTGTTTTGRVSTILRTSPLEHPAMRDLRPAQPCLVYQDDARAHRLLTLAGERISIGREEDCDLVIDWDRTVSRHHAVLERTPQGWTIADGGRSMNGTLLNGARIGEPAPLRDGDLIQVGETALGYRAGM